jgi:hypothetical protein
MSVNNCQHNNGKEALEVEERRPSIWGLLKSKDKSNYEVEKLTFISKCFPSIAATARGNQIASNPPALSSQVCRFGNGSHSRCIVSQTAVHTSYTIELTV